MSRTNNLMFADAGTAEQRQAIFDERLPYILSNLRSVLLVFHYAFDNAWNSAVPNEPGMDSYTAAFFLLGIAAWLSAALRSRDPGIWFMPLLIFTTLLASALAISNPAAVPSYTRASGVLPPAFLLAALPLAVFCRRLSQTLPRFLGPALATVFAAGVLLAANGYNTRLYFDEYAVRFGLSWHAQARAGKIVRGFAESDGHYGNAFSIGYPHYWDYRGVGIEAGAMFWENSAGLEGIPRLLRQGLSRQDPYQIAAGS